MPEARLRWLMSAPRARYQIEERIGSGAFGTVYRAKMVTTGGLEKLVALKILRQDQSTRFNIDRLQHEARLLAMLRHRAIVRVIDLVHLPQGWTLVLEYVEGLDFVEIARLVTLPPRAALEVVGEVAAALHAGWTTKSDNGPLELVHQDIKLANIILTAEGTVKLLDLGIASSAALDLPADPATEAMIHGTIRYMAPERFENVAGPASDIYSLGVVLSELLGQRVSGRPDTRGSMEQGVRLLRHSAGQAVATLFERMVCSDPGERPTALEVSRVCRQLQSTTAGATLADWAMDIVPELTEERTAGPEDESPDRPDAHFGHWRLTGPICWASCRGPCVGVDRRAPAVRSRGGDRVCQLVAGHADFGSRALGGAPGTPRDPRGGYLCGALQ